MFVRRAHVSSRACSVPWALKGPSPPVSLSTFLRPNGRFSLRNGFGVEERSMRLGLVLPPPKRSPVRPSVRPRPSCVREGAVAAAMRRASEQADRQLDNGSRLGKIRGKREREREKSERVSEGGSGRYSSYVARATGEGDREGEREWPP